MPTAPGQGIDLVLDLGGVGKQDVQEWIVWLLGRYSPAYASNQLRALQQFFRWPAAERRSRTRWRG